MLIQTKHLLTTLVVAGTMAAALPASAVTVFTPGDLLLGFRATGGQGAGTSLFVNIGSSTTLRDTNTASSSLTLLNINQAIVDAYGANWQSRTDLNWGLVGSRTNSALSGDPGNTGDPARTLYTTKPNSAGTVGVQSSATGSAVGTSAFNSAMALVASFQATFQGFTGTGATELYNSGLVAAIDQSLPNTWDNLGATGNDLGIGFNVEGNFATAAGSVLDLYRYVDNITATPLTEAPTANRLAQWQGTVSLAANGDVLFTPTIAAVPEPGRALLAGFGLMGIAFRRRRAVKKTA